MPPLHPGDMFPELSLTVPGGDVVKIPEWIGGARVTVFASQPRPRSR
jgi:hypothetical protein